MVLEGHTTGTRDYVLDLVMSEDFAGWVKSHDLFRSSLRKQSNGPVSATLGVVVIIGMLGAYIAENFVETKLPLPVAYE